MVKLKVSKPAELDGMSNAQLQPAVDALKAGKSLEEAKDAVAVGPIDNAAVKAVMAKAGTAENPKIKMEEPPPFYGHEDPPTLPAITNSATGSTFHVVGTMAYQMQVSLRFWLDKADPGFSKMHFRIRIGDRLPTDSGVEEVINVTEYLKSTCPEFVAACQSPSQKAESCSLEGAILIPYDPWDHSNVMEAVMATEFPFDLWKYIAMLPEFTSTLTLYTFAAYVRQAVYNAVSPVPMPAYAKAEKQVLWRAGLTPAPLFHKAPKAPQQ